jgi:triphosphoribosyl-dephospho-CoA synthase
MRRGRAAGEIEARFLDACHAELTALKPGNVHVHSPGHGMEIAHFERAASAAAPFIADPTLSVGKRILLATEASFAATGLNANLGIVLLCAPLAKAAAETTVGLGLRRRLAEVLAALDVTDADAAFAAIRIANPAGLGTVEKGDVTLAGPHITLSEAMYLAKDRDRIANAYVTAYEDVFDFALPLYDSARREATNETLAISTLHMGLLSEFPDSHIARKYGIDVAIEVQREAIRLRPLWCPVVRSNGLESLMKFDIRLKGKLLNPGTTADFVVATLFAAGFSLQKQS